MSSDPRRVPVIPPREPKVPLSKLVSCFRGIYDALAARDAHLDGESAAAKRKRLDNIGHLRFAFQHWINSWWNGHLFRVDLRLRLDPPYEPPFTDNPALLRNFCTWWLLSSGDQEILRNYLERLVQRIQSGDFDEESALPPFEEPAREFGIYLTADRPQGAPNDLSPRLRGHSTLSVSLAGIDALKSKNYIRGPGFSESFVPPQLVPPCRFSAATVEQTLKAVHDGVQLQRIELETFTTWGKNWWTTLFAPHAGKPCLALWYCLSDVQRGELLQVFLKCAQDLQVHRERALIQFFDLPLSKELEDPHSGPSTAVAHRHALWLEEAFKQGAVIKTGDDGYDRCPAVPHFLETSAHSLSSSVLNRFSHRQRAIYRM